MAAASSDPQNWQIQPVEGEKESDQRGDLLLCISHYLLAPQHFITCEGIRWSKFSWRAAPLEAACATVRMGAAAIVSLVPLIVGSFLNIFVQREAARLQGDSRFSLTGKSANPLPEKLRIFSLNICTFPGNWNAIFGSIETSGHARLERLVQLFHEQKADVICLQEVFEPAFAIELKDRLKQEGWEIALYNAGLDAKLPITSGLFVASRVPVSRARYIPFEPWFSGQLPRGVLQLGVGGLDILVTHLTPSRDDLNPNADEMGKRKAEIATIAEHLSDRPAVLVGDLNAEKKEFESIGPLDDLSPEGPTCTEQFTLDGEARLLGKELAPEVQSTAFDRIFAKGVDVQSSIVPSFKDVRDPDPLSDHHGLVIELSLPTEGV